MCVGRVLGLTKHLLILSPHTDTQEWSQVCRGALGFCMSRLVVSDLTWLLLARNLLESSELSAENPGLGMWRSGPRSNCAVCNSGHFTFYFQAQGLKC